MQHTNDQKGDKIIYVPVEDRGPHMVEEINKLRSLLWRSKWFIVIFCLLSTLSSGIICMRVINPKFISSAKLSVSIYAIDGINKYFKSLSFREELKLNKISLNEKFTFNYVKAKGGRQKLILTWKAENEKQGNEILKKIISNIQKYLNAKLVTNYDTEIELLENEIELLLKRSNNTSETQKQTAYKAGLINEFQNRIFKIKVNSVLMRPRKIIVRQEPLTEYETYKLRKWAITILALVFSFFTAIILVFAYNLIKRA